MKDRSKQGGVGSLFDIESPMAIELRRIMIQVGRQLDLERKRALMITSAERGEGKSLFTLHFALVLAYHMRSRVLLLDADVRRPVQHTVFQSPVSPGFANLLEGKTTVEEATSSTRIPNLDFMPAGTTSGHISSLFGANQVRHLVEELHKTYDIVLLDTPPVVPVSDPLHFVDAVDGCLFLVMAGMTPKDVCKRGVEILRKSGANILGVVANNLGEVLPYYYDQKYYGYEKSSKKRRA